MQHKKITKISNNIRLHKVALNNETMLYIVYYYHGKDFENYPLTTEEFQKLNYDHPIKKQSYALGYLYPLDGLIKFNSDIANSDIMNKYYNYLDRHYWFDQQNHRYSNWFKNNNYILIYNIPDEDYRYTRMLKIEKFRSNRNLYFHHKGFLHTSFSQYDVEAIIADEINMYELLKKLNVDYFGEQLLLKALNG